MPKEISEWQEGFWFEARLAAFRWEECDGAADFSSRQGVSHEHIPKWICEWGMTLAWCPSGRTKSSSQRARSNGILPALADNAASNQKHPAPNG
ncbi:hypothetical protein [Pedosphaera parvula]|uniref:hypothetical protein n=1 Tax=Pedosphaera parvula TaxID=1032527 RepID=UPI00058E5082|nr:hypothetical protein [Pedosphaera parvula]